MTAYDPSAWTDLFVATAGASAALVGLVFVAVSINIERILSYPGLTERALETVLLLMGIVVASIAGLIPGQSSLALGLELLVVGALVGGWVSSLTTTHGQGAPHPRAWLTTRWTVRVLGTVPIALAGISLILESGGGLYWLAAGIVFAVVGAIANAWVLLVEILR